MILMLKNINIGEDMNENCSFLKETYILTRGSRKRAWLIVSEGMLVVCSATPYKPLAVSYVACPDGHVV